MLGLERSNMIVFEGEQEKRDWKAFAIALISNPNMFKTNQKVDELADELIEAMRKRTAQHVPIPCARG